jgi:branched-chain amino acid transport system ATP-binding protein
MSSVLGARGLSAGYAGHPIVHDLDLDVEAGEVVCVLGANGAGKTTTMLALSGELPPIKGEVLLDGQPTNEPLWRRARKGMAFVTEERSVLKGLSTRDNLRVGGVDLETATALFPELEAREDVRGGLLSGGEQQMLTLARALGRRPRILLADELSLGLAPLVVERLLQAVRQAADQNGTAVLMVEQHARKAIKHADRVLVMRRGELVLSMTAQDALANLADVEHAYLSAGSAAVSPAG